MHCAIPADTVDAEEKSLPWWDIDLLSEDSLELSDDDCSDHEEVHTTSSRPPRLPAGPPSRGREPTAALSFDGVWALCSPKGDLADWLDSLTISGDYVLDGGTHVRSQA